MTAAIPYTTFPRIDLGLFELRTFGVMVAVGVLGGAAISTRWAQRWGWSGDRMTGLATRMVVAGLVGARVTWLATNWSQVDSPLDTVALWQGGLQFSGGFLAAVLVAVPAVRRMARLTRWRVLDGTALGLTVGLAIGRVGCYAVGEHLGGPTGFFLATRYDGGETREGPLVVGEAIHNTALYEILHLAALAALLAWLLYRRTPVPGTAVAVFAVWYGTLRFLTDFARAYDDTVLGLTGAQWMSLALVPAGIWVLARLGPRLARERAVAEAPLARL